MSEINDFPGSCLPEFNRHLKEAMLARWQGDALLKTIEYALFPGGKRLRPLLCCAVARDLRREVRDVFQSAVAVECVHISSLIHDDLPCLDNDSMRRGEPSCHIQCGEASALLAGDALIGWAFQLLSATGTASFSVSILAEAYIDLCLGQHRELVAPEQSRQHVAELKTGSLFAAALRLGGAEWSGDVALLGRLLGEIGKDFGVLFQVQDDREDEDREPEKDSYISDRIDSLRRRFISLHELTGSSFEETKRLMRMAISALGESEQRVGVSPF